VNNETKNKLTSGTDQADLTSGNACWETPPAIFAALNDQFGPFDLDICADAQRALYPRYFGPGSDLSVDALIADWSAHGFAGYCNPPYGAFIGKILPVAKAQARLGFTSVFLIPMRVTRAFKAHIMQGAADLLFCDSRIVFFENGAPRLNRKAFEAGRLVADSAVFDSIVVRYAPDARDRPRVDVWEVPDHVSSADLSRAAALLRKAA
jgi:phage N-6-adenine-methyltransferase